MTPTSAYICTNCSSKTDKRPGPLNGDTCENCAKGPIAHVWDLETVMNRWVDGMVGNVILIAQQITHGDYSSVDRDRIELLVTAAKELVTRAEKLL